MYTYIYVIYINIFIYIYINACILMCISIIIIGNIHKNPEHNSWKNHGIIFEKTEKFKILKIQNNEILEKKDLQVSNLYNDSIIFQNTNRYKILSCK
jgi:hypothetical protein